MAKQKRIKKTKRGGKLAVLLPGLGAVSTTFIAGVEAARSGLAKPVGSLTQMGTLGLAGRSGTRVPRIKDFVPLARLEDLCFAAWDVFEDDAYQSAVKAGVLDWHLLERLREKLEAVKPLRAAFDQRFVKRISSSHIKEGKNKRDLADQVMQDIAGAKESSGASRAVMVWCGSTEAYLDPRPVHRDLDAFEKALEEDHPEISPSMLYAYAAIKSGVPFANGSANLTVDIPALTTLAAEKGVPVTGKDFKTGQTFMKTVIAPALRARSLGLTGWFSTNILGNRDAEVLDDPDSFRTKEESKLSVLDSILEPELHRDLYADSYHKVRINYYPPRGDNKECWDNIDIFGWLGYPMQIKVDFLCRDSILAAPMVLDLALFLDLAQRAGLKGVQQWLSFYFKSPMTEEGIEPEHDLFIQLARLKNTLRGLMGEEELSVAEGY